MQYGNHPTIYQYMSDSELNSMWRSSFYNSLSAEQKQNLCQETVNRASEKLGMDGQPLVIISSDLDSNDFGTTDAYGNIKINENLAVNGKMTAEYKGTVIEQSFPDANYQVLNTCLHETRHAWQDQVADCTIECEDAQLANEFRSNGFDTSFVTDSGGNYQLGSHYLKGCSNNGYYLYYFQSTERDAHKFAEEQTNSIVQDIQSRYGTDQEMLTYYKSLDENGYKATESQAMQRFQNNNFEHDLNQTLMNIKYGTDCPVNQNTEQAVKNEMIASYKSMVHQQTLNSPNNSVNGQKGVNPSKGIALGNCGNGMNSGQHGNVVNAGNIGMTGNGHGKAGQSNSGIGKGGNASGGMSSGGMHM